MTENWIRSNNPLINAPKLEAEIAEELARRGLKPRSDKIVPLPEADSVVENEHFFTLLDHYASIENDLGLIKRAGVFAPVLRPFLKIFSRLQRNQRIFNLLVIEVLRSQQEHLDRLAQRNEEESCHGEAQED